MSFVRHSKQRAMKKRKKDIIKKLEKIRKSR